MCIVSHLKNHYALYIEIFTYPSETYLMTFYEVIKKYLVEQLLYQPGGL
jgi:hypothetical protein